MLFMTDQGKGEELSDLIQQYAWSFCEFDGMFNHPPFSPMWSAQPIAERPGLITLVSLVVSTPTWQAHVI